MSDKLKHDMAADLLDVLAMKGTPDIAEASTTVLSAEAFDSFCAILDEPLPEAAASLLARKPIWA